jgi:hypothetical protein
LYIGRTRKGSTRAKARHRNTAASVAKTKITIRLRNILCLGPDRNLLRVRHRHEKAGDFLDGSHLAPLLNEIGWRAFAVARRRKAQ